MSNPTDFPDPSEFASGGRTKAVLEPIVKASIIVPESASAIAPLFRTTTRCNDVLTRPLSFHWPSLLALGRIQRCPAPTPTFRDRYCCHHYFRRRSRSLAALLRLALGRGSGSGSGSGHPSGQKRTLRTSRSRRACSRFAVPENTRTRRPPSGPGPVLYAIYARDLATSPSMTFTSDEPRRAE